MIESIKALGGYIDEAVEAIDKGDSPLLALKRLQYAIGELLRNPMDDAPIVLEVDETEGLLSKASNADIIEMLRINHEQLTRAKVYEEEFKNSLLEVMEANAITKSSNEYMSASYIEAKTTERFDAKRFQAEHPELAKEYMMEVQRKGYVRVSYKD